MPNRVIREGILASDRVNMLDHASEVFYRRLLSKVDDHGLYDARPSVLRASLYPVRLDRVREADIERWIAACVKAVLIVLYESDGKPYLKALDTRWQARSDPKFPVPPPSVVQATVRNCTQLYTKSLSLPLSKSLASTAKAAPKNGAGPPEEGEYQPKTPIQQVVCWFKVKMGEKLEDRAWDVVYFPRFSKPAKELLLLFGGDVDACFDCIDGVVSALEKKGLSWKPETVVSHASDYKNGRLFK